MEYTEGERVLFEGREVTIYQADEDGILIIRGDGLGWGSIGQADLWAVEESDLQKIQHMQIGDRVRVRIDLAAEHHYGPNDTRMAPDMMEYCGREFVISSIEHDGLFHLDGTARWFWHSSMLDLVSTDSTADSLLAQYILDIAKTKPEQLYGCSIKLLGSETVGTLIGIDHVPLSQSDSAFICEWDTGIVGMYPLSQFKTTSIKIPKGYDPDKEKRKVVQQKLADEWKQAHRSTYKSLDEQIASTERELAALETTKKTYEAKIESSAIKLADFRKRKETEEPEKDGFLEEISQIKKLESVDRVYITKKENIVVITKELFPITFSDMGKKETIGKESIGSYTIAVMGNVLRIYNRMFKSRKLVAASNHYEHPHVTNNSTGICFGDNLTTMNRLVSGKDYFQLIDFLITFLTSWNVAGANPFIGYETWIKNKFPITYDRSLDGEVLIEL